MTFLFVVFRIIERTLRLDIVLDVIESIINTGAYKLLNEFHCWYHERFFDDVVGYHTRRRRYDNFFNSLENFSYSSYS
jgi:hypothetical protein